MNLAMNRSMLLMFSLHEALLKSKRLMLASMLALVGTVAYAFAAPAAGDFMYDAYDIAFNKLLFGPAGWVGGGMLLLFGIESIRQNWKMGVLCFIGAGVLIKLQALMTTLGAIAS